MDLSGPSGTVTRRTESAGVLHFRYATEPTRPWRGLGPLEFASLTGQIAANIELDLGQESSFDIFSRFVQGKRSSQGLGE